MIAAATEPLIRTVVAGLFIWSLGEAVLNALRRWHETALPDADFNPPTRDPGVSSAAELPKAEDHTQPWSPPRTREEILRGLRLDVIEVAELACAAMSPAVERCLQHAYGTDWQRTVDRRRREEGRRPFGPSPLSDPRSMLALIAHDPAFAGVLDERDRRRARGVLGATNAAHHGREVAPQTAQRVYCDTLTVARALLARCPPL